MRTAGTILLSAIFILFCIQAHSQNESEIDSVLNHLKEQSLSVEDRIASYYWLANFSGTPEDIIAYSETLYELAEQANNTEFMIRAKVEIGVAHRFLGNLGQSLEYLFESANEASEQEGLSSLLADIYLEISTCYTQNGDSDNALLYGSKSIEILRKTNETEKLGSILLNTGYDYYLIGNYDSAMSYYNESELLLHETDNQLALAYLIGNRALVYWKLGNNERAKTDLFQSIDMLRPLRDDFGMADYPNQLGSIFLEEGNEQEAITYTMQGLEMAKAEGLKEQVRDASYLLFQLNRTIGAHEAAADYLIQHYAYRDSIQNLETTQEIANLRTEFEVGQKQAEVDLLLQQRRSNQTIMVIGGVTLFVVICLVIIVYSYSRTKGKLNTQLQEQKNALISLNNTKDKFFSIISHDLRGPVGVLSGLVSVTKYFIEDKKTDQLRDMMDKMEHAVDRLVKLLDNLLHWALQQRGHFPYVPENYSAESLLKDVQDMFIDMATSKSIDLRLTIEKDFNLYVDKNTTNAILRNLVNNAIKFTPNGGLVQIHAFDDGEMGIIRFQDSGVGIPAEKLNNLFQLSDHLSTKGTSGETGLGLGLQLVNDFVQLNKGEILVTSEVDKGTTFTIQLPLKEQPA